MSVDSFVK